MKKLLALLAVLALTLGGFTAAEAGWYLKQKDSGTAVWTDETDNALVGSGGVMSLRMADPSTAITEYIVSTRTGRIVAFYGVQMSPGSGANAVSNVYTLHINLLSAYSGRSAAPLTHFKQISDATFSMSALSDAGTSVSDLVLGFAVRRITAGPVAATQNTPPTDGEVEVGSIIAIHTDGAGTGTSPVMITIVIE
jgi:hypothetical protein